MRYLTLLILSLLPFYTQAGLLKGKVTDEKGVKLPYATIFLQGTTIGTTANGNGDYELPVDPGLYKVICQYVGFRQSSFNATVAGSETIVHNFTLQEQSLDMKEVVVHANAEDPAYEIIRNTIKRRSFHLEQVLSFQTSIYLKGILRTRKMPDKFMGQKVKDEETLVDSVGKGVLYLLEEDADFYTEGNKHKTVIHSVHESGNNNGVGFSQFPPVITFYSNNVNVMGDENRGFISPVSDNAFLYYRYKLLGEFREQEQTIYKIQVIAKRDYEPCFSGTIYIADKDFAIHSLNMVLAKRSGMDILDTLVIRQLFVPLRKDTWVIKSQLEYLTINLFGFDVTGSFVNVYNNQKVNEHIPDSVFADKVVSAYDKGANKKDSAYWQDNRPIPLETDEKRDFIQKDSLTQKLNDPAHRDSVRKKQNRLKPGNALLWGYAYRGKDNKNIVSTNAPLLSLTGESMVNYNIVEGVNIVPKIYWRHRIDTQHYLNTDAVVRYGCSNMRFNAAMRMYVTTQDKELRNRGWTYGAEGGRYVYQYNPANPVNVWYNTYEALLYHQNDIKLYERSEATAFVKRNYGNGLSWSAKAAYQERMPLANTSTFSFSKRSPDGFTPNTPPHLLAIATAWEQHTAALLYATVSYRPGVTFTQYPDYKVANRSKWPKFTLQYEKGIPGIVNSRSDFDKWRFNVADDVRLKLLGTIKYNLVAGGFINARYVSIPDLTHLYGNRGIGLASPYLESFQFAQFYNFSNKEALYGELHIEHHLKGLISNKLPLFRQAQFYLLWGSNVFYANPSLYYAEAFVGIDNIGWKLARMLRVDFVQSWDSDKGHIAGIRLGLNLNGAVSVSQNNPSIGEW